MSCKRSLIAKPHSKEDSKQQSLKANEYHRREFYRKKCERGKRRLERKLFCHIFNSHFFRQLSHQSFLFTFSTSSFRGKSCTKAAVSHLQLSVFEGSSGKARWDQPRWLDVRWKRKLRNKWTKLWQDKVTNGMGRHSLDADEVRKCDEMSHDRLFFQWAACIDDEVTGDAMRCDVGSLEMGWGTTCIF